MTEGQSSHGDNPSSDPPERVSSGSIFPISLESAQKGFREVFDQDLGIINAGIRFGASNQDLADSLEFLGELGPKDFLNIYMMGGVVVFASLEEQAIKKGIVLPRVSEAQVRKLVTNKANAIEEARKRGRHRELFAAEVRLFEIIEPELAQVMNSYFPGNPKSITMKSAGRLVYFALRGEMDRLSGQHVRSN